MTDAVFKAATDLTNNSSTTSLTHSHTVDAASNMLFVGVFGDTTTDDVTGVTYNGVSMTLVQKLQVVRWLYLYKLVNPATGAHNVVISCSSSHLLAGIAADFSGVDTIASAVTNTTATQTLTTSITTTVNRALLLGLEGGYDTNNDNLPPSAGTNATRLVYEVGFGSLGFFNSSAIETPVGSYSIQTTRASPVLTSSGHILTALYNNSNITVSAAAAWYGNMISDR